MDLPFGTFIKLCTIVLSLHALDLYNPQSYGTNYSNNTLWMLQIVTIALNCFLFICDNDIPPAIICHAAKIVLIASECGSKIHIYASYQHQVITKYPVQGVYKYSQLRNSYCVLDDFEKNILFFF